jgi:8-oxo-dGTP pyrophosphatase MutT (NUDIX family)
MSEADALKIFFVGVKGIIVRGDKILLLKKSGDRAFWDAPGGRINGRETIQQALLRELHEELPSIKDIVIGKLLHAYVLDRDIKNDVGLTLLFYKIDATLAGNVALSDEHSDYEWMTFDDAIKNGSEGIAQAVSLLRD